MKAVMACVRCPYTSNYELLWQHGSEPLVMAVMLRCCAGPELQVRRGAEVLLSEFFKTVPDVVARAKELRDTFVPDAATQPGTFTRREDAESRSWTSEMS
jgi:thymidylate synthase ThyX